MSYTTVHIISYNAPIINTWNKKNFTDPGQFNIHICPDCASIDSFKYNINKSNYIIKYDLNIDRYWEPGDNLCLESLQGISLSSVEVHLPVFDCVVCRNRIKIIPSSILKGTILTVKALIYVIFIYQNSELSWRIIANALCREYDKLAHSTLYKGAHRLGHLLTTHPLMKELEQMSGRSLPEKLPPKSVLPHTMEREKPLRKLAELLKDAKDFIRRFNLMVEKFNRAVRDGIRKLPMIYIKGNNA